MSTTSLSLNPDEVNWLLRQLETALGETRVELHHTHSSPAFRQDVKDESALIRGLLERLRSAAADR